MHVTQPVFEVVLKSGESLSDLFNLVVGQKGATNLDFLNCLEFNEKKIAMSQWLLFFFEFFTFRVFNPSQNEMVEISLEKSSFLL